MDDVLPGIVLQRLEKFPLADTAAVVRDRWVVGAGHGGHGPFSSAATAVIRVLATARSAATSGPITRSFSLRHAAAKRAGAPRQSPAARTRSATPNSTVSSGLARPSARGRTSRRSEASRAGRHAAADRSWAIPTTRDLRGYPHPRSPAPRSGTCLEVRQGTDRVRRRVPPGWARGPGIGASGAPSGRVRRFRWPRGLGSGEG